MTDTRTFANFIRIVELGSLSRAAERGSITQSALSQQVAALEAEFRGKLLHRSYRGAVPTPAGEALYRHLKTVMHHLEIARHDVASADGEVSGTVTIGLPVSMAEMLATPLFLATQERFPQVRMRVIGVPNRFLHDHILQGALDFAFVIEPGAAKGVNLRPVADEQVFLMIGHGSRFDQGDGPVDPVDLHDSDFVMPSLPHSIRTLLDTELSLTGRHMNIVGEVDNHTAMIDLAASGRVNSILPWSAIHTAVGTGRLRARPIARLKRRIGLCSLDSEPLSMAAEAVRDIALDLLGALVADGTWRGLDMLDPMAETDA